MPKIQLIAGRSHPGLAQSLSGFLKVDLTPVDLKEFADGEIYIKIKQKVRRDDVYIIQSVSNPVNENLMELLIMIDAAKRASAASINVVCPYLGYGRQDRKATSREPITAKLVANLITTAGADRVVTVDLHTDQVQGFYDIPVDHFVGYPLFAKYLVDRGYKDVIIVSPDIGGVKRARRMAELLGLPLAIVDKRRIGHNQSEVVQVIGEVKDRTAVLIDDMIDTAGTVAHAAEVLVGLGAAEVIICATHALLSGPACERLEKCPATKVLVLDTVSISAEKRIAKMEILTIAPLLSKIIKRVHRGRSLGKLFTWEDKRTHL